MSLKGKKIAARCLAALAVYVGVSCVAYAIRHPQLTDTERLFRFLDALIWK